MPFGQMINTKGSPVLTAIRMPQIACALLAAAIGGCFNAPGVAGKKSHATLEHTSGAERHVVVETTQNGASATGAVQPSATATQVVKASANSAIAGTTVAFPPGTLAVATEITIAPGEIFEAQAVLAQLDQPDNAVTSAGQPVSITSSTLMDATQPFTLAISLPPEEGAALIDRFATLAILYHVKRAADGVEVTGLMPRDLIDVTSGYAAFSTRYFGTYQAVLLKTAVVVAKEVAAPPALVVQPPVVEKDPTPPAPTLRVVRFTRGPATVAAGSPPAGLRTWNYQLTPATVGQQTTISTGPAARSVKEFP